MYFIVKNNRIYNVIIHIHPFIRYFLSALIITIMLAMWLFMLYFPIEKKIRYYNDAIKQAHQQSRKIDAIQYSNTKTHSSIERLHHTLCSYDIQSCHKKDIHKTIASIFDSANTCKLTIHNYSIQPCQKKNDHNEYPINICI